MWRIHRHIGVGGDQLVAGVAGDEVEQRLGDAIRDSETRLYGELIGEVRPFEGARELIVELRERGHTPVLASSAKAEETEHYIELLDARELIEAHDHVRRRRGDQAGARSGRRGDEEGAASSRAVMIGDSTWDVEAAARAGVKTIAVLTGGFSEAELLEAGAVDVFESLVELRERLDATPLR